MVLRFRFTQPLCKLGFVFWTYFRIDPLGTAAAGIRQILALAFGFALKQNSSSRQFFRSDQSEVPARVFALFMGILGKGSHQQSLMIYNRPGQLDPELLPWITDKRFRPRHRLYGFIYLHCRITRNPPSSAAGYWTSPPSESAALPQGQPEPPPGRAWVSSPPPCRSDQ